MKKIFTLLTATGLFFSAFAQNGQRDRNNGKYENDVYVLNNNHDYDKHNKGYRKEYLFSPGERDRQIDQINRDYNYRIMMVKNKSFMSWFQKKRLINNLEEQRLQEVNTVMDRYNDSRNQYGYHNSRDKKRW